MIKAVVGANWGDEGKGKITDMLAKEADIIVRFQGGANAGHTIVNDYGKFALHTLPSGVFYNHTTSVIGNGVALNVPLVFKEIQDIVSKGVPTPKILISDRAQMVMSYHILFDQYEEERLGGKSFGSTKSGIAPFYSDKFAKINVSESPDGKEYVVDYFISESPEKGDSFIEYNIYRFKSYDNGVAKSFLILAFSKRMYGDLESTAKSLARQRDHLLTTMIEFKIPEIKVVATN